MMRMILIILLLSRVPTTCCSHAIHQPAPLGRRTGPQRFITTRFASQCSIITPYASRAHLHLVVPRMRRRHCKVPYIDIVVVLQLGEIGYDVVLN